MCHTTVYQTRDLAALPNSMVATMAHARSPWQSGRKGQVQPSADRCTVCLTSACDMAKCDSIWEWVLMCYIVIFDYLF